MMKASTSIDVVDPRPEEEPIENDFLLIVERLLREP